MNIILSKSVDEWVHKNRWIASLSNGETIFDDFRPINPAWERLAEYCEANDLSITALRVQIDGLEVSMPKGREGYIQKKKVWTTGATSGACFCIGYTQGNKALIDELGEDHSSRRRIVDNPGEPWVIYRSDIREKKHG